MDAAGLPGGTTLTSGEWLRDPIALTTNTGQWQRVLEARLESDGSVAGVQLHSQATQPGSEDVPTSVVIALDGLPEDLGQATASAGLEGGLGSWSGGFSFVHWLPEERALRAYRDHYGARSLYYGLFANRLFLASDLPAILGALGEEPPLDESAITEYLATGVLRDHRTFYRGIRRLPAASRLTADRKGFRVERYWSPWIRPWNGGTDLDDFADEFRRLFRRAVARTLSGSKSVGVLLSGGPDSSAVLGMVAQVAREEGLFGGRPGCALTLVFEEVRECDEAERARETAGRHGFTWKPVRPESLSPFHNLDEFLRRFGEPPGSVHLALESILLEAARQEGNDVLLDGHDADTLFSPSGGYLSELFRRGRWVELLRECVCLHKFHGLPVRRLFRETVRPLAPESLRRFRRRSPSWIRPEACRRTDLEDRLHIPRRDLDFEEREAERILDPGVGLALEGSRVMERMHGVEGRHPYFDPMLVRFLLSIPLETRFARGETKILLRRALSDLLTPSVRGRLDKTNYTGYLAWSLRRHLGLRLRALAEHGSVFLNSYIDWNRARPMLEGVLAGGPVDLLAVWRILALEEWLMLRSGQLDGGRDA